MKIVLAIVPARVPENLRNLLEDQSKHHDPG